MIVPSGVKQIAACGYHSLFVKAMAPFGALDTTLMENLVWEINLTVLNLPKFFLDGVEKVISGVIILYLSNRMVRSGEWGILGMVSLVPI